MPHETDNPQLANQKLKAAQELRALKSPGQILRPEPVPLSRRVGPGFDLAPIQRQLQQVMSTSDLARQLKGEPGVARPKDERRGAGTLAGFDFGIPPRTAFRSELVVAAGTTTLTIPPPSPTGRVFIERWEIMSTTIVLGSPTLALEILADRDDVFIEGESVPRVASPLGMGLFTSLVLVKPPVYIVGKPGTSVGVRLTIATTDHYTLQVVSYRLAES